MYPISWLEFAVGAAALTVVNVAVLLWLGNTKRRAAKLSGDAEREALKAEIAMLREENETLRSKLAQPVGAPAAVSPYGRAIEMARSGAEVGSIAGACGISRGEAELIVALHRSGISSS